MQQTWSKKLRISCGDTSDALLYEMEDMEHAGSYT